MVETLEHFIRRASEHPRQSRAPLYKELLRAVRCFAGLRLYLDETYGVPIDWKDVKALSEGSLPPEDPEVYDLPVARLVLPRGLRLAFGRVRLGKAGGEGRLLCLPDAGH